MAKRRTRSRQDATERDLIERIAKRAEELYRWRALTALVIAMEPEQQSAMRDLFGNIELQSELEVAYVFGVSVGTVDNWCSAGLPFDEDAT
jgi:hypothetical protein